MKNIIIKDDVYNRLTQIKGKKSFSDLINEILEDVVELRRKSLRKAFGSMKDAEIREISKIVEEVRRVAKGRLF